MLPAAFAHPLFLVDGVALSLRPEVVQALVSCQRLTCIPARRLTHIGLVGNVAHDRGNHGNVHEGDTSRS